MNTEKCDPDVYKNGEAICVLDACRYIAQMWVEQVAAISGQPVDWHYVGGRAVVKYLGDKAKVTEAILKALPVLSQNHPKTKEHVCRCAGELHNKCSASWL